MTMIPNDPDDDDLDDDIPFDDEEGFDVGGPDYIPAEDDFIR